MALPTPDNLKTMDYAFQGQPFVDVPAKDAIDIKTMDYAYRAQPFVRNYGAAAPPSPSVEDEPQVIVLSGKKSSKKK